MPGRRATSPSSSPYVPILHIGDSVVLVERSVLRRFVSHAHGNDLLEPFRRLIARAGGQPHIYTDQALAFELATLREELADENRSRRRRDRRHQRRKGRSRSPSV